VSLRDATRELHHAAEKHVVGASMANGSVLTQWWADWLSSLLVIHAQLDLHLPPALQRVPLLLLDMEATDARPRWNYAAVRYAVDMNPEAAAYVFTGAHLMGGAVMAKRLAGKQSCHHLTWADGHAAAVRLWSPLRERTELAVPAREAFGAIIKIMDEIVRDV
jgi:hypothetical protein